MKLSQQDTTHLQAILQTAKICGIEKIIIEDGFVRGLHEARACVIISDHNVPKLPQKVGLSRLNSLRDRLALFDKQDPVIEARETERGEIAALDISAGRSRVSFRCTSTVLIKAPKVVNDEVAHEVYVEKGELTRILSALRVMSAKKVQLTIRANKVVTINLADDTNDAFTTDLEQPASGEPSDTSVSYYSGEVFSSVLTAVNAETSGNSVYVTLAVGEAGTIRTSIGGHSVIIMPLVGEDEEEE
jgi:hypothetical protein